MLFNLNVETTEYWSEICKIPPSCKQASKSKKASFCTKESAKSGSEKDYPQRLRNENRRTYTDASRPEVPDGIGPVVRIKVFGNKFVVNKVEWKVFRT
ncbi:hypothetical protein GWI33_005726 [Rhynchophorus ferrugineus]|uniref:Uncharacterized protein n=1 Tax=Rhynchophorus ferrugineus TaxID=354439 RepID=A0A834IIQ0_RHYFE|nr:hypothetical protein GWI33_005726 [Rhynchophorus ferrugineus]